MSFSYHLPPFCPPSPFPSPAGMGVDTPIPIRHLPKLRALRSTRHGAVGPPEEDHLPLFDDLRSSSLTYVLYPFSTPNEIEQCLAAADMSSLKSLPSFNLSVQMMRSCDFLKNDCEKSESNWLVTPPDSPLFPTLDLDQIPVIRTVHILRKRESKPKSPLAEESKHTIEETSSISQEKDTLASKMGSDSQTAQKQYQKQDSKRKLESSQGKKKKENQKSRINDNTYATKPRPGKRQKNGKA